MPYTYKRSGSPFWYIGFTEKEKKLGFKPYSSKTKNKTIADQLAKDKRIEIKERRSQHTHYIPAKNIVLSSLYKDFCLDRKSIGKEFSIKTIESYDIALSHLYNSVGDKNAAEYTKQDYYAFIKYLDGRKCKQNSKSIYSRRIFALFNWLKKENYILENPFKRVQEVQKEVIIRTKEEVTELLNYAKGTKFYWYVRFQKESAFRMNEVLTTTADKIGKDIIRVQRKGNIPNFIPITKRMKKLLDEMPLPKNKADKLFPFSEDAIFRFFNRFTEVKHIPFISHDLRKYTLSEFANKGIPINYTKDYAGHTSIITTLKYYVRAEKIQMVKTIDEKLSDDDIV